MYAGLVVKYELSVLGQSNQCLQDRGYIYGCIFTLIDLIIYPKILKKLGYINSPVLHISYLVIEVYFG